MIGNKLGPVERTVQVLIDRSYPVVKEVYLHLNDIISIQEHMEAIEYVASHADQIEKIQDAADSLIRINEHLDEVVEVQNNLDSILILTPHVDQIAEVAKNIEHVVNAQANADKAEQAAADAASSAKEADDYAELAKKWAVGEGEIEPGFFSSRYYAQTCKLLTDENKSIHTDVMDAQTYLRSMEQIYRTLRDHVSEIKTTAQNINSVVNVATDLVGGTITDASQDLGMIGTDGSNNHQGITGGNIKKVADEIKSVRVNADNIEDIKTVADAIEDLPNIKKDLNGYVVNAQKASETAKTYSEVATEQAVKAANSEKYCKVLFDQITNMRNQFDIDVGEATQKAVETVQNQEAASKTELIRVTEVHKEEILQFAKEQEALLDHQVDEATKQAGISTQQAELSTQKAQEATDQAELAKAWATKMDGTVDGTEYSAKYYANKAKEDFSQAVEEGTQQALDAIKNQKDESLIEIQNEGNKQVERVVEEGTAQVEKATEQAQIATDKAAEAVAQAQAAQKSAENAAASETTTKEKADQVAENTAKVEENLQKSQETLEYIKVWSGIEGQEETWTVAEAVSAGSVITFPNKMKYLVGRKHLRMVWNGLTLVKEDNYSELGETDTLSNRITINFDLEPGDVLNAWTVPLGSGDISVDESLLAIRIKALEDLSEAQVFTTSDLSGESETNPSATLAERVATLESLFDRSVYKEEV